MNTNKARYKRHILTLNNEGVHPVVEVTSPEGLVVYKAIDVAHAKLHVDQRARAYGRRMRQMEEAQLATMDLAAGLKHTMEKRLLT